MGRTVLLERRQSESVGRRNSRTTFLRSDWPRPFARREVGVEMDWEIHRNYPTATNTHTKGYMKIEAQSADDHREITNYLKEKQLEHYVIEPHPQDR
ncbi:hypothetical protein TNCV_4946721 [Trichonephila clavipes]|nr:hypothetical protein TNCV_4946721 [Trichonephila clavipes]